jgi:hypothetical protein
MPAPDQTPVLFNVIVPTRQRAGTLLHCLRTVVSQDHPRLRIIVSDNCSEDSTPEVVASFADARVEYIKPPQRLSMARHWEFALSHVREGWVMFIGDDDGLLPGALSRLDRLIRQHRVQAVNAAYALYVWPEHFPEMPQGKLVVPVRGRTEVRSTSGALAAAMEGHRPYTTLPWLYNGGCADVELINSARGADGKFFQSQTPDLYSAITLCLATDRYLAVAEPVAIGGTSRHSTGAAYTIATTNAGQEPIRQYLQEDNIPFHPDLLLSKSLQIMLYECYLQARHLHRPGMPRTTLARQLEVALETAPPQHRHSIEQDCRQIAQRGGLPPPRSRLSAHHRARRLWHKVLTFCGRIVGAPGPQRLDNVELAAAASRALHSHATESGLWTGGLLLLGLPAQLIQWLKRSPPAQAGADIRVSPADGGRPGDTRRNHG